MVLTCPLSLQAAPALFCTEDAEAAAKRTFRGMGGGARHPDVSTVPADIQRNTAWFEQAFRRRGFQPASCRTTASPCCSRRRRTASRRAPRSSSTRISTASPLTRGVGQESPWKPVSKRRGANGQWEPSADRGPVRKAIDPELALFARSSSDDKAPYHDAAGRVDAPACEGMDPAVNVKVLLRQRGRGRAPIARAVIRGNLDLLRCNDLVVHDGPIHPSNRPTLVFGNRGNALATLTVYGPKQELHSGHYGNYVPNPAQRLAQLLASMKDEDGRVTIAGYYDRQAEDAARRVMAAVPDDEPALRKRLGIAEAEKVGGNYQEAMQYPSLNIRGLKSADVGAKPGPSSPTERRPSWTCAPFRRPRPEYLLGLLKAHIEKQELSPRPGRADGGGARPLPQDRLLAAGRGGSSSGTAVRTDLSSPIGEWLRRGLKKTHGADRSRSA